MKLPKWVYVVLAFLALLSLIALALALAAYLGA